LYQCSKYDLFVGRVVVRVGIGKEVSVPGFTADVDIKGEKMAVSIVN
jgi:hypothetical protein